MVVEPPSETEILAAPPPAFVYEPTVAPVAPPPAFVYEPPVAPVQPRLRTRKNARKTIRYSLVTPVVAPVHPPVIIIVSSEDEA